MENTIKIGLLGCGRVAHNHIEAIGKCKGAEVTAVAGGSHAKEFGEKYSLPVLDAEELVASELVDAVCVLTPPQFHYGYTMKALEAGKHVLVEKPVSFREEEIQGMDQKAKEKGRVCMPGHSYLYLPELARIKHVMEEKKLGIPTYLYLSETYYMVPELFQKYTGPEIDVLCHQLYLALAYLGKPEELVAFVSHTDRAEIETGGPQVTVMLKYPAGTLAQILVSWAAEDHTSDPWTFKVKILGSRGGTHFSRRDLVQNAGEGYEQCLYQEMFDREIDWFVEKCIKNGESPLSTMEDAAWVCRLHKMVLESAATGKVIRV